MSRPVLWTAFALFLTGALIFAYKTLVLEMPIRPDRTARVWRVELSATLRTSGGPVRVSFPVPRSDPSQVVLDAQREDDGLGFELVEQAGMNRATWRGQGQPAQRVSYTFRVHLPRSGRPTRPYALPEMEPDRPPPRRRPPPAAIAEALARIGVTEGTEPDAIIATTFQFVANEIESAIGGSDDALLTLASREGSELGRVRLIVELLRGAGVPAHVVTAIRLDAPSESRWVYYAEARSPRGWIPLVPTEPAVGRRPGNLVVLTRGDPPLLSTAGVEAASLGVQVLREELQPSELAALMTPSSAFWQAVSLYRVPIEVQSALEVLLLVPLAALVAAIFRNLIGFRTFGTFMPILIALSLRRTDLLSGAILVTSVLGAGVVGRLLLDRLRLLFVPRICLLLSLVVIFITALAQIGHTMGGRALMTGLLFPIVILAMLIERISVTTLEEGYLVAAKLLAASLALSLLTYPIFRSQWLAHLYFGFPELILCTMAPMVLIGGYTGYRLAELWRFRSLAAPAAESGP